MQRVEGIADLMRHTRRQQGQRLHPLAFDRFKSLLPRLRGVVQDQRHPRAAARIAIQRRRVQPEEPRARIMHLKLQPRHVRPTGAIRRRNLLPIHLRQNVRNVHLLHPGCKPMSRVTAWLK